MNEESEDASLGQELASNHPPPLPLTGPQAILVWCQRFLACNPFYLVSAALFLFGLYRISVDPNLFHGETAQLIFNLTSLQIYELLLIGTALFLGRRGIWYDSTLLVILEGVFAMVPFVLISQAGLIDQQTVGVLCAFAAALAAFRFGMVHRWLPALPLTGWLRAGGLLVLAINAALPIVFRIGEETKLGINMTVGTAYIANEVCWLLVLPLIFALLNLLPGLRDDGKPPAQRRWFPVALFSIWALGSGAHLFAVGYVYDFGIHRELLAPTLWVLAWTVCRRLNDFIPAPSPALRRAAFAMPLLTALVAAGVEDSHVFFSLAALNSLALSVAWFRKREDRVLFHLLLASLAMLAVAWPIASPFDPVESAAIALVVYLVLCSVVSRNPMAGLAGALAAAAAGGYYLRGYVDMAWPIQAGLIFLMLHSLRWRDEEHLGAVFTRGLAAFSWWAHSIIWVHGGVVFWQPATAAFLVLAVCVVVRFVLKRPLPWVVPVSALFVTLSAPADVSVTRLQTTSTGVLAMLGSLLLFAVGTGVALTRHRWFKREVSQ